MKAFEEGILLHMEGEELNENGEKKGIQKAHSIIDRYGELKVSRKTAKAQKEDWEVRSMSECTAPLVTS